MDALTFSARVRGRDQRTVLGGCRDMLKEAAKQFRLNDDPGHAGLCELHKAEAENILQGRAPYKAAPCKIGWVNAGHTIPDPHITS